LLICVWFVFAFLFVSSEAPSIFEGEQFRSDAGGEPCLWVHLLLCSAIAAIHPSLQHRRLCVLRWPLQSLATESIDTASRTQRQVWKRSSPPGCPHRPHGHLRPRKYAKSSLATGRHGSKDTTLSPRRSPSSINGWALYFWLPSRSCVDESVLLGLYNIISCLVSICNFSSDMIH
jgi:hypothetical protein